MGTTSTYPVMAISAAVLGMASGGLMPGWTALLARIYGPMHCGRVLGRMLPVAGVMSTLIVPFVGLLFDRSGDYARAFMFLAVLVILATVFLAPLRHNTRLAPG
jgi:MFS family permease